MSTNLIIQVKEEYATFQEAAKELGISRMTLWRWMKEGKISGYRLGREVLINRTAIEELKTHRCVN